MTSGAIYQPKYGNSWALIVGINNYTNASPLAFAKNDAEGIAGVLQNNFDFPSDNIELLLDSAATGSAIRKKFLQFSNVAKVTPDDRLIVFFAGHGHTITGKRGEVGFLVPHDGDIDQIDTLIRWDELTRDADLIPAKHIFFMMDACYGGLALTRKPAFGTMRFLGDMLQRYARQVLTAGKADETVSDGNGVRPGHSIFTAHLLNGLEGAAATQDGIVTASGIMAYVYERVGQDQYSQQTPHHGFIDGDGDFVFDTKLLEAAQTETEGETGADKGLPGGGDLLINTSPELTTMEVAEVTVSDVVKELISDPSKRIKLDDFVLQKVRKFLELTDLRNFPSQTGVVAEEFSARLAQYEAATKDLQHIVVLVAKWGDSQQLLLLEKIFVRLAEADKGSSGLVVWLQLAWYPLMLLMYSAGISALASRKYDTLRICLLAIVHTDPDLGRDPKPLVAAVMDQVIDLDSAFKMLPGLERKLVPRSEHAFKTLQPILEDELLLGRSYDTLFDEFELLLALTYSEQTGADWGPIGRFGWKQSRRFGSGQRPLDQMIKSAKDAGANWAPLVGGLFKGSPELFSKLAESYNKQLSGLHW